jgi:hypothetical protein
MKHITRALVHERRFYDCKVNVLKCVIADLFISLSRAARFFQCNGPIWHQED